MHRTMTSTADITAAWCRWLFDSLDAQLEAATSDGLPADGAAMGIAHIMHGLEMARHVGEFPATTLAAWLRVVAVCLEKGTEPPLLMWCYPGQEDGDAVTVH